MAQATDYDYVMYVMLRFRFNHLEVTGKILQTEFEVI